MIKSSDFGSTKYQHITHSHIMIAALFLFVSTETNAQESLPAMTYSETSNHYYSEVIEFDQNAQCGNLIDVIVREDYVLLSECIELCETLQNCTMVQYYDRLLSDADSRCYVFDEICELSTNVGDRANTSHIYYKNQLTNNYISDAISSDESMRMIIPCFMHYAP
eukprot:18265_1